MSAEFRQRHMRVIELNEYDVASQIRMNHGRELEVVDAALDQILQGLDAFAHVKQRPDSRLEDAQMFLAVRSFNSLHIARQLLERGYYQQASALVRMVMEDQLVAEDAETHPPTLDALLDGKGRISKGNLTYRKMAERISPEAKKAWVEKYGDLSERAAHPRRLSLLFLTTVRRTVRPGGHYDEIQVKLTILYLLGVCPRNNVLNDMRHWWSVKMLITPLQSPECCKQVIVWRFSSPGTNTRTGS